MNSATKVTLALTGTLAVSVLGFSALGGRADAAKVKSPKSVVMYANVDAEGDLGSNVGATQAEVVPLQSSPSYRVSFSKPIGSCAAVVQVGRAGGSDNPNFAEARVINYDANTFSISFLNPQATANIADPFMMTVTCAS